MMPPEQRALVDAGLLALGYLVAKEGIFAFPVEPLARALKGAGADSSHVDDILATVQEERAALAGGQHA